MVEQKSLDNLLFSGQFKGVIFDFDGTIVDLVVDWEELKKELKSKYSLPNKKKIGVNDALNLIRKNMPDKLDEAYKIVEEYESFMASEAKSREEIVKNIKRASNEGLKIGMFTNNMRKTVEVVLRELNLNQELFDIIIAKEDVEKYKPDSEGLNRIVKKWGLKKSKILYIGDSTIDRKAGELAGIRVALVD